MKKSMLLIALLVGFIGCQSVCLGTMSNTTARETLATGDGATTAFTFSFPIDTGSSGNHADLEVRLRVTSTGVETGQTETTHYTVTATNNNFTSGGTVTFVTAPAATQEVLLLRATAQTQLTDFGSSGVHLAIENADDKLTRQMIDLQEEVNRCLKFPKTDAATLSGIMDNSVDRASQRLGFSSTGEPAIFSSGLAAGTVTVPAYMVTVIEASTSEAVFKQQTNLESGIDVQVWDAQLDDIAALAVTNSNFIVGDGVNWVAESGATALTSLGAQPLDAGLTSIAGLTTLADKMIYTTASDTYTTTDLTAYSRTLFDDVDAAAWRVTLGAATEAEAIKKDGSVAYTGTGDGFKDEDDMSSNSATATSSQQSNKAYVDTTIPVKAWVNFDGQTGTINGSGLNSTPSRTGEGRYTVTWGTDFANDDYAVVPSTSDDQIIAVTAQIAGSCSIATNNRGTGNAEDATTISVIATGTQ